MPPARSPPSSLPSRARPAGLAIGDRSLFAFGGYLTDPGHAYDRVKQVRTTSHAWQLEIPAEEWEAAAGRSAQRRRRASTGRSRRAITSTPPPTRPHQTASSRAAASRSSGLRRGRWCRVVRAATVRSTAPSRAGSSGRVNASRGWTTPAPTRGRGQVGGAVGGVHQPGHRLPRVVVGMELEQQGEHAADLGRGPRGRERLQHARPAVEAVGHRVEGGYGDRGAAVAKDVLRRVGRTDPSAVDDTLDDPGGWSGRDAGRVLAGRTASSAKSSSNGSPSGAGCPPRRRPPPRRAGPRTARSSRGEVDGGDTFATRMPGSPACVLLQPGGEPVRGSAARRPRRRHRRRPASSTTWASGAIPTSVPSSRG